MGSAGHFAELCLNDYPGCGVVIGFTVLSDEGVWAEGFGRRG